MVRIRYSNREFERDASKLAQAIKLKQKKYNTIYGVPRGGIPLALVLSRETNIPIIDTEPCDGFGDDTLIVDDVIDSGATRQKFKRNDFAVLHIKEMADIALPLSNASETFAVHWDVSDWIVYWWEKDAQGSIEDSVIRQLQYLNEDITRPGLLETPKRVIDSWKEIYGGYHIDHPESVLKVFEDEEKYDELILLKNIEFYSMCEHHMLPFFGNAHVAYIPDGPVVGISKLSRLVEIFARRLQIQERICKQVTNVLMEELKPKGSACIIEADHLCMRMRGINKQNSIMVTSSLEGAFRNSTSARNELMRLIK